MDRETDESADGWTGGTDGWKERRWEEDSNAITQTLYCKVFTVGTGGEVRVFTGQFLQPFWMREISHSTM